MSQPPVHLPPPAGTPGQVADLRADLGAAGYTVDGVAELLGPVAGAALHREQRLPALLAARRAGTPAATLLRAFGLGDEVTVAELDAALPATRAAGAAALGLVALAGAGPSDAVRAAVDLRPYAAQDAAGPAHWWLASDLGESVTGRPLTPDHVLGVGGASLTLAQATVRDPRRATLDLGTGCGVQALHAARHSARVVATDVSARALAFAALNAGLAGVAVDLRAGSLLDPVAGETFDLVVSNPPFVITPAAAYAAGLPRMSYRDGGRAGDDLVRDLVTGLGPHLAPGGVAQLLGNWEHHAGEGWAERVQGWLADAGLDGWVVQREVQDPAEYAELWLSDGGLRPERDRAGYEAAYAAWLADFTARGVTGIGFGHVLLRRPVAGGTSPWRRVEELTGPVRQPLGGHVASVLAAHDWLAARDDAALAGARLVVAADVTEERYLVPGAADPQVLQLRQGGGYGRVVRPGSLVAGAVGACDGELTLAQIVAALAQVLDLPAPDVAAEVLPAARGLVLDGFLHPVES
ncbi:methyltransferase [Georgenia sp. TF02-10]|uniref:DUF7059 domain-containing protein n=1 Tax=Georgenia sp. TF02-10 TaxID=2917725 RepID=UPI001FA74DCE|nr:methyltransferase [Georgenia sp. TF02-10]UNX55251.1 methyltransferase [Georgenia sp. TF02-10]